MFLRSVLALNIMVLSACTSERKVQEPIAIAVKLDRISSAAAFDWQLSAAELGSRCEAARQDLDSELGNIVASVRPNFFNSAERLDRAFTSFSNQSDYLGFYRYVINDPVLRKASQECENNLRTYLLAVFTRQDLYRVIKTVSEQELSPVQRRLVEDYLYQFESNGLNLSPPKRARLVALKKELVELQTAFEQRLNDWNQEFHVTKAEIRGLPESIVAGLEASPQRGKDFILTLKYPHFYPALKHVENAALRKTLYSAFVRRGGTENRDRLSRIIAIRLSLAKLLGYKNFAEMRLKRRMAADPATVQAFLSDIRTRLRDRLDSELEVLRQLKQKELARSGEATLHPWDIAYYSNILLETSYKLDSEEIKQYFEAESTVAKMLAMYQKLLGLEFREDSSAPIWHKDVRAFSVRDKGTNKTLATFYMDLFPRKGKYGHAAAFSLIKGYRRQDGSYQKPVSAMLANFSKATASSPALLTHGEAETLFHEFGHIMHQVLSKVPYGQFSGTAVMRDFVEAPSQIFENWLWDPSMLATISSHYQNKRPMPEPLIKRLLASRTVNKGIYYTRQNFYASVDMAYHTLTSSKNLDTSRIYQRLFKEINRIEGIKGSYPEASFAHIVHGYAAGYYGYMWSKVFAQDMFTRFAKEGLVNPKTGRDYRLSILEPGGTEDPKVLIRRFLGRNPNNEAFLDLIKIN